jgi:hypothetical protein
MCNVITRREGVAKTAARAKRISTPNFVIAVIVVIWFSYSVTSRSAHEERVAVSHAYQVANCRHWLRQRKWPRAWLGILLRAWRRILPGPWLSKLNLIDHLTNFAALINTLLHEQF